MKFISYKIKALLFASLLCNAVTVFSENSANDSKYFEYVANQEIINTGQIILKIKDEYVEEVTEQKLAEACLETIYPQHPGYTEFLSNSAYLKQFSVSKANTAIEFSLAVAEYINSKVSNKEDATQLFIDCRKAIAKNLDTYSDFITKDEFKLFQELPKSMGVIGVEIVTEEGSEKNTITSVFKSGPADMAGIRAGDLVISIDGVNIQNLSKKAIIIDLMRGRIDSHIVLEVQRTPSEPLYKFDLQRKHIITSAIHESKLIRPNYGYIRINSLNSTISKDFSQKLFDLYSENKNDLYGLIVDIRNNKGGLLEQSSGVAAPLLPPNSLVAVLNGRMTEANMKLSTNPKSFIRSGEDASYTKKYLPAYKKLPLVILIDKQTASGAEIIAGALQDHKRATIMGQSSNGVNTVQTILPMYTGEALKITTALWSTPSGHSIKDKGVTPDIVTAATKLSDIGSENDVALNQALDFLIENHKLEK